MTLRTPSEDALYHQERDVPDAVWLAAHEAGLTAREAGLEAASAGENAAQSP